MIRRSTCFAIALFAMTAGFVHADDAPATQPATTEPSAVLSPNDPEALNAAIDKTVTVEGVVESAAWSASGKVMNVVFKDTEDAGLLVTVFSRNKDAINAAFDGDAAAKWTGAKIQITGKIEKYGGKKEAWKDRPQIVVNAAEQVKIIEPAK